jgi:hemolysin D
MMRILGSTFRKQSLITPVPPVDADTTGSEAPDAANANAPAPIRRPRLSREDQEFLPAALEILETPPSPVRMALIWVMAAFVTVALLWCFFGRLDVIAIAQGKIQPPGRVKVVQPTETAKVLRIGAQNSARVREGEILVEFDPSEARADREALAANRSALLAEIIRRDEAIRAAQMPAPALAALGVTWPEDVPELTRRREAQVLAADLAQLGTALASLDAQITQKQREKQRLEEMVSSQSRLVATLNERVAMRNALAKSGFGTRSSLIDGKETLQKEETVLAGQQGQLREAEASLKVLAQEKAKQLQGFLTENTQKRADAARTLEEIQQRLAKAAARLANMTLRSPAEGVVQASAIYTIGQVVTVGQEIMRIVPISDVMEVEAYLPNKDIGFVRIGQEVSVKIDSFPFTRYGMLSGKVSRIADDAIPLPEATQIESNSARAAESTGFSGAQRTQNLVFPVTITLESKYLSIDGQRIAVSPGMTVTAEVKTGSRRILEYLFSPLVEVSSEAMRER